MLEDYKSLKKGEVYTIDGESDRKKSRKVLECECVWINVSKLKINTTFSFVTNAAPDEIERLTSEIRKQEKSSEFKRQAENTYSAKDMDRVIEMPVSKPPLTKGVSYRVIGESLRKSSWILKIPNHNNKTCSNVVLKSDVGRTYIFLVGSSSANENLNIKME